MTTLRTAVIGLGALLLMHTSCREGASLAGSAKPGFSLAVFDEAGLNVLLSDSDCVWVRFYNARREMKDEAGSVMAVAVDVSGREYPITTASVHYRLSDKIVGSDVSYLELERDKAVLACNWMREAGMDRVACDLSAKVLRRLLNVEKCNGLRVTPSTTSDGQLTMRFASATLEGGVAREITGAGTSVTCGEPCPMFCSDDVDYVHDEP